MLRDRQLAEECDSWALLNISAMIWSILPRKSPMLMILYYEPIVATPK